MLRYLCGAAALALPFNLRSAFMCDIAMINEPTFLDILGSLFRRGSALFVVAVALLFNFTAFDTTDFLCSLCSK